MEHLFTYLLRRFGFFSHRQSSLPAAVSQQPRQSAQDDPPDPFPGRELVFTLIREYLLQQQQVAEQQDAKASGLLIGGTTMVGFAFLIQHHLAGNCSSLVPIWLHDWPISVRLALPYIPFLLCYILSVVFALRASRIQGYWTVPEPVKALKSMNKSEKELKRSLSHAMAHFAKSNELTLDKKAFWIQWTGRMLLAETIALVLFLLYQNIC